MAISTIMGQFLFLSALCVFAFVINKLLRLDLTLSALVTGVLAGMLIPLIGIDTGIRASNIHDIVFYLILPVLIFEAAWHLNPQVLRRWIIPVLSLATAGVLLGCIVVAVITFYGIRHEIGFPWLAALLTGAILAATDPVSVVSKLKELKAPQDLAVLIEGESLFNDATAVVLFSVILGIATMTTGESNPNYFTLFLSVFIGGILVGVICGLLGASIAIYLGQPVTVNIALVLLAFGSFYIAEHLLHVSGVMAVMSAAIVAKILIADKNLQLLKNNQATWEWLGLYFNSLIFVLMGLTIVFSMFVDHWLSMLIAIVASLVARLIVVYSVCAVTSTASASIPMKWRAVMFWGGLKGAIGIALVLSLPVELPYWWTIQSMVFGVVLFSILVQGTTMGGLIRRAKENP